MSHYTLPSHQVFHITPYILIGGMISHKLCSKFYIALLISNSHLHHFYSLVIYRHDHRPVSIKPQVFHQILVSPEPHTASLYSINSASCPNYVCTKAVPPSPSNVVGEMEQDTMEYQVESFLLHSPYQPTQLAGLLEHRDPRTTTTTTSSDSNTKSVVGSTSV